SGSFTVHAPTASPRSRASASVARLTSAKNGNQPSAPAAFAALATEPYLERSKPPVHGAPPRSSARSPSNSAFGGGPCSLGGAVSPNQLCGNVVNQHAIRGSAFLAAISAGQSKPTRIVRSKNFSRLSTRKIAFAAASGDAVRERSMKFVLISIHSRSAP